MDRALIGKIEKAKRYAEERDRICFESFVATIHGDNRPHTVRYNDGKFDMDDEFFRTHGYSSHTMAMERVLEGMIESPAKTAAGMHAPESTHISKVEKAKRYADECQDRIRFDAFVVTVKGDNSTHTVCYEDGKFDMDNDFFQTHGYTAHTMTMERVLKDMLVLPPDPEE